MDNERMSDERLDNLTQSWQEHVGSLMEEYGAPTVHSILSRTESEAMELLDALKAERERVKELENALREIVFFAKPNRLSTKNKLVKEGICISGSLQHYEVMPHLIHIGKGLLQEQPNE